MKPSVLVVEDNKYMLDYFVETFKKTDALLWRGRCAMRSRRTLSAASTESI